MQKLLTSVDYYVQTEIFETDHDEDNITGETENKVGRYSMSYLMIVSDPYSAPK